MNREFFVRWFFWMPVAVRGLAKVIIRLSGMSGRAGRLLKQRWSSLSHFRQNLIIGVLIALVIHFAHGTRIVRGFEDLSVDWMNRIQVDTEWLSPNETLGYTLLDIDETSFRHWGQPFHVPRDQLAHLIRYAANGGAKAIVVDVDLSRPGTDPAADTLLKQVIETYPEDGPDLILMRTMESRSPGEAGLPVWRQTIFDDDKLSAAVHWAHPRYTKDRGDLRLRRWRLIEHGCLNDRPATLPSAQLLMDVLATTGRSGWHEVRNQLNAEMPCNCQTGRDGRHVGPEMIRYADKTIALTSHGVDQRVIYAYSPDPPAGKVPPGFIRLAAHLVPADLEQASADPVHDRIVVIGASYADSRDLHETPVGRMSGALVLVNAIKSLSQYGQLHGPPAWVKLLLEALLILLMAYAFARFDSFLGTMITGTAIILVLVPISFWVFRYGIWIDLAAPILGMQLHQAVANWEEGVRNGGHGTNQ